MISGNSMNLSRQWLVGATVLPLNGRVTSLLRLVHQQGLLAVVCRTDIKDRHGDVPFPIMPVFLVSGVLPFFALLAKFGSRI